MIFEQALALVYSQGYWLIFIAMVIEGPIVNAAASFAASLGYFNIFLVWIIAFLGDLVGDLIYYYIGYYSSGKTRFKISRKIFHKIMLGLRTHAKKTIVAIKLTPLAAGPGLIAVGAARIPLRKYLTTCILTIIPMTLAFTLTGFYFGHAFKLINRYFNYASYLIVFAIIFVIVFPYVYRWIFSKIVKKYKLLK